MKPAEFTHLVIVGAGRSGSTVLDRVIGSDATYLSSGELQYLWHAGFADAQLCECGQDLTTCSLWGNVLETLSTQYGYTISEAARIERRINHRRYYVFVRIMGTRSRRVRDYLKLMDRTLQAIRLHSDISVLVDSSLDPTHALLMQMMSHDVRLLHLIRDPRAVAFSRLYAKPQTAVRELRTMPTTHPVVSFVKWTLNNMLSATVARQGRNPSAVISYEAFSRDPRSSIESALADVDLSWTPTQQDDEFVVPSGHIASGNPNKLQPSPIKIRPDGRWQEDGSYRLWAVLIKRLGARQYASISGERLTP